MANRTTLKQLAERIARLAEIRRTCFAKATELEDAAVIETQNRMARGLQPDGTQQPPLKHQRASKNTGPPLIDFGYLRYSVTAEMVGTTLRITATGPGARRHQHERPFLGASPELKAAIRQILAAGIAETTTTGA